jgi:hypothetical protein
VIQSKFRVDPDSPNHAGGAGPRRLGLNVQGDDGGVARRDTTAPVRGADTASRFLIALLADA